MSTTTSFLKKNLFIKFWILFEIIRLMDMYHCCEVDIYRNDHMETSLISLKHAILFCSLRIFLEFSTKFYHSKYLHQLLRDVYYSKSLQSGGIIVVFTQKEISCYSKKYWKKSKHRRWWVNLGKRWISKLPCWKNWNHIKYKYFKRAIFTCLLQISFHDNEMYVQDRVT